MLACNRYREELATLQVNFILQNVLPDKKAAKSYNSPGTQVEIPELLATEKI